jgi:signal peptidase I
MVRRGDPAFSGSRIARGVTGDRYGGGVTDDSPRAARDDAEAPPPADSPATADPARRPAWRRVVGSTWFHLAAALVITGLVLSFVAKPYWVPSSSMEQTLMPGDRVLVDRLAYLGGGPGAGDVVVFDAGDAWGIQQNTADSPLGAALRWIGEVTGFGPTGPHTLIKRAVAVGGQTIACCSDDGRMLVDGDPVDEPYVGSDYDFEPGVLDCDTEPRSLRCLPETTVPEGAFAALGDNRTSSADSAALCRTPAPEDGCWRFGYDGEAVGRAAVILWPIDRWSGL